MSYVFTFVFLFVIRCYFPKSKWLASTDLPRYGNHTLNIILKYDKIRLPLSEITPTCLVP